MLRKWSTCCTPLLRHFVELQRVYILIHFDFRFLHLKCSIKQIVLAHAKSLPIFSSTDSPNHHILVLGSSSQFFMYFDG